jgi:hypothetical protein
VTGSGLCSGKVEGLRELRAKERGSDGAETERCGDGNVQIPIDVLLRSVQSTSDGDLSGESRGG